MKNARDVCIVGYAETKIEFKSGRNAYELAGDVFSAMLDETKVDKNKVDGLSVLAPLSEGSNPFFSAFAADALGITARWLNFGGMGGCSAASGVARAASAIREGQCEIAVVISSDAPSTNWRANYGGFRGEFCDPMGLQGPVGMFGLLWNRYVQQYELDVRALGKIAVTQRENALKNDLAYSKLRKPLTMEDYLKSRYVAEPMKLLDSVMFCDGANGVMVTSTETADRLGLAKRVFPIAYGEVTNHAGNDPCSDILTSGFNTIGKEIFAKTGMSPRDIRMVQLYDDFTIAVMMQLEQLGFCEAGQGSKFINDTDISINGTLPVNTGGGQLSAGQPGLASGGLTLVEAVRQLFGEAGDRQVPDPRNALVTGIGVGPYAKNWLCANAMILEA
jgi:acetyl-CoA acetyltransferase